MKRILINLGIFIIGLSLVIGAFVHVGPIFGTFALGIVLVVFGACGLLEKEADD